MNNAGFRSRPLTSHQSIGIINEKRPKYSRESLNVNHPKATSNLNNNVRIASFLTSMKATGMKLSPSSSTKMMMGSGNMIFTSGGIGLDYFTSTQSNNKRKEDSYKKKGSASGISRMLSANKTSGNKFFEFSEKRDSERRSKENHTGHNFVKNSSNTTKETVRGNRLNSRDLNNESFLTPRKSGLKEETYGKTGSEIASRAQDDHKDMDESSGEEISVTIYL